MVATCIELHVCRVASVPASCRKLVRHASEAEEADPLACLPTPASHNPCYESRNHVALRSPDFLLTLFILQLHLLMSLLVGQHMCEGVWNQLPTLYASAQILAGPAFNWHFERILKLIA